MLVSNDQFKNKVVTMKLTTGEEIITRVVETTPDGNFMIKNPLSMIMIPSEDSMQGMVGFAPWILGAPENVPLELNKSSILVKAVSHEEAARQYSDAIGEVEPAPVQKPRSAPVNNFAGRGRGR